MAALNSFILFKKNTTKGKYKKSKYKFKDFILDCVEKVTEPNKQCVEGEVSINEVNGETIASRLCPRP
jgi:predicted HicB family RNase H-like nuclease